MTNEFEKFFSSWWIMKFLEKAWKIWENRDSKLLITERRSYLVPRPNYHTTKSLAVEMNKAKVFMNKRVYLGLLILDISKTSMYEFCYDYVKPIEMVS